MPIIKSHLPFKESFVPPTLADRDAEVHFFQKHFEPLTHGDVQPVGVHVVGGMGTGKTVTVKVVLENASIPTVYLNMNSLTKAKTYQALSQIVEFFKVQPYGSISRLESVIRQFAGEKPFVVILDEVDDCPSEELDKVIHFLSRETAVTIIVISRKPDVIYKLSRDTIDGFKYRECLLHQYSEEELVLILKQRQALALHPGTCDVEVLKAIAKKAANTGSARYALDLLGEIAMLAEADSLEKISVNLIEEAEVNLEKNLVQKMIGNLPPAQQTILKCLFAARDRGQTLTLPQLRSEVQQLMSNMKIGIITDRMFYDVLADLKICGLVATQRVSLGQGKGFDYYVELAETLKYQKLG